mgnify:CR=1 FL=1
MPHDHCYFLRYRVTTGHPVFFNEEKAQGVFFLPQSIDASHLVRKTATLNEHESPSIHWGVQVIRRSPRPTCRRPHSNHRCSQATLRVEQSETNSVGARGFIPLTR